MINDESKTGIALFQVDEGVDSGPIAGQKAEPIHLDDTIATVYARIEERGLELLHEALPSRLLKYLPPKSTSGPAQPL